MPFGRAHCSNRQRLRHPLRSPCAPGCGHVYYLFAILENGAKVEKEAHGEFESEHPGYCGAQDTFYVGNLKGVGRIYQQTFIDTYTKVAFAMLYDRKTRSRRPIF